MKVKIGKYKYPVRIELDTKWIEWRYGKKLYGIDGYTYNPTPLDNIIEKIDDVVNTVLWHTINRWRSFDQSISVRIDPYDVWSMDHTLGEIALPMLKMIREDKHGSPHVDNEDVPEELHAPERTEDDHDIDDHWHDRWAYVLDEMIFAFDSKKNEFEYLEEKWDPVVEKAKNERIQNGFELFGKYYQGLWT